MAIELIEVKTKKQLREFIYLPLKLHRNNPFWVPPVYMDEWKMFNPDKNSYFSYCDTIMLIARKDDRTAGRVMGIIHNGYNKMRNEKTARFGWFDCINDREVAHALLGFIANWAIDKGMDKLIGPFGFSDKDPQGLLITGFDRRAVMTTAYHPPYYKPLIEEEGFIKEVDLVEYLIPVPDEIPDFYKKIYERASQNQNVRIKEFKKKVEMKPFILPVLRLMNETFMDIYGSFPLTEEEMIKLAREYLPVLDPDFVKIVLSEDEQVVAFFIGMPDISVGLKKARGKLLPFGIFHILKASRKTDQLVLLLGGIKAPYQGIGLDVMMGISMLESATRREFKQIDSHLELETNVKVRAEMERMGGKICKVFRIYQRSL